MLRSTTFAVCAILVAGCSSASAQDAEISLSYAIDETFVGGDIVVDLRKPGSRAGVRYEGKLSQVTRKVAIVEMPTVITTRARSIPHFSKIPWVDSLFKNHFDEAAQMQGNLVLVQPSR